MQDTHLEPGKSGLKLAKGFFNYKLFLAMDRNQKSLFRQYFQCIIGPEGNNTKGTYFHRRSRYAKSGERQREESYSTKSGPGMQLLKISVVWTGGMDQLALQWRSLSVSNFLPQGFIPDVFQVNCLQQENQNSLHNLQTNRTTQHSLEPSQQQLAMEFCLLPFWLPRCRFLLSCFPSETRLVLLLHSS